MTRPFAIGVVLVAAILGGCSSDEGTTASSTPTSAATPTSTRTPTATPSPPATVTPTPTRSETAPPTATPTSTASASPTATIGHGCCGDGTAETEWNEECDDGNAAGGDGCAPNCSLETSVSLDVRVRGSLQTGLFLLEYNTDSQQTFRFGKADGSHLPFCLPSVVSGEISVAQRVEDLSFAATSVPGLVCVCTRAAAVKRCGALPRFGEDCGVGLDCTADAGVCDEGEVCVDAHGPGNATSGAIGCGGLGNTDYERSTEGDGAVGAVTCERSGEGAPGSAFLFTTTAVGVILDGGTCDIDASNPGKGQDGIPCNDDDPPASRGTPQTVPLTTGTATGRIDYSRMGAIALGQMCGSEPCHTSVTGRPFSCAALEGATPDTGDFKLCSALGLLSGGSIDDSVATSCTERR